MQRKSPKFFQTVLLRDSFIDYGKLPSSCYSFYYSHSHGSITSLLSVFWAYLSPSRDSEIILLPPKSQQTRIGVFLRLDLMGAVPTMDFTLTEAL